ncbi:hypothetical protein FNU79_05345 [Deinococcus detaillensis]|uniref:ATP-binding protein n=1 Tax=Deinococcus detaillensis TaxID=2592048 RepID=A0A553V4C7_9DEIO|nr:hypothetical protein [Deinococcus detaillensis]TSA87309.1 hypothetical protein FNU79_05345 [Deinococcus detaillensis]
MFYVISGAAGSGKTTLLPFLRQARPEVAWQDFDERWTGGGRVERQELTQRWIETALEHGRAFGLLGQCPLGEVLAAPDAPRLEGIRHLLVDLSDVERIRRLMTRGDDQVTQETLNWAAWLRVHQVMPDWRPNVLMSGGWPAMRWERWHGREADYWPGLTLNVSGLTPAESAERVLAWLDDLAD